MLLYSKSFGLSILWSVIWIFKPKEKALSAEQDRLNKLSSELTEYFIEEIKKVNQAL